MRKLIPFALVLLTALLFLAVPAQAQACDYGVAQLRLAATAYDYAPAVVEEVRVRRVKQVQQIERVRVKEVLQVQQVVKQVQQVQRVRVNVRVRVR